MNAMFDIPYTKEAIQMLCSFTAWVLSCKLAAYFKNTFSQEHLWTAASVYKFQLSGKFSTHMTNNTREKIELSCINSFRSIVLLVFALATALRKFCFR